jgi:hypothetical protein
MHRAWIPSVRFAWFGVPLLAACASTMPRGSEIAPLPSSHAVLTADRLRKMVGVTAFDALRTMPSFLSLTTRQPGPRFLLIIDGARTSTLDLLKNFQATDLLEIRVVGDSQSLDSSGEVQILVITQARPNPPGCSADTYKC